MIQHFSEEKELLKIKPSLWLVLDKWIMFFASSLIFYILSFQICIILSFLIRPLTEYVLEFLNYHGCLLPSVFVFFWAAYKTIELRSISYLITSQRLVRKIGVFSIYYDEIELLRVRDFEVMEPFYLRMLGLGNISVFTAEVQTPQMLLYGIHDVVKLRDALRRLVIKRQVDMGYREVGVGGNL